MDATGQQTLTVIVLVLSVVGAVAAPVLTFRRLRSPQRRRDAWLGANAQPVLSVVGHVLMAVGFLGSGLVGLLLGVASDLTLSWALVPLSLGGLASLIVTVVVSSRIPTDIAHEASTGDPLL